MRPPSWCPWRAVERADKGSEPHGIRLWGEAYGVTDAETRPFHELSFVTTVVAPCAEVANDVVTRGMNAAAARAYVESWSEPNDHGR